MVQAAKFPNVRILSGEAKSDLQGGGKRSFPPAALAIGINDGVPPGKTPFDVWNNAAIIMQIEPKIGAEILKSSYRPSGLSSATLQRSLLSRSFVA